jgi:hypothetical protein
MIFINRQPADPQKQYNPYGAYPCLCLCLGLSQSTLTTPFLLTILHFGQIAFTEGLTFIYRSSSLQKQKAAFGLPKA